LEGYRVRNKTEGLARRRFRRARPCWTTSSAPDATELLTVGGNDFGVSFMEFLPRSVCEARRHIFDPPRHRDTPEICVSAEANVERDEREEGRWVTDVYEKLALGGNALVGSKAACGQPSVAVIQQLLVQEGRRHRCRCGVRRVGLSNAGGSLRPNLPTGHAPTAVLRETRFPVGPLSGRSFDVDLASGM
jgi:hypothetical protein